MRSRHLRVLIDLDRVRASAEDIRRRTRVELIAVVKADGYGLGAAKVADVLAGVADELAYFSLQEAREVGKPGLVLGPPDGDPAEYAELGLRPTLSSAADAARYADVNAAIEVDTGMQRFGCAPADLAAMLRRCRAREAFAHAVAPHAVDILVDACAGLGLRRHAAASALLHEPAAWLDAVRPGVALYRGAVRVTGRLVAVRDTTRNIGYTGFAAPRVGILLAGYSHGLRAGPALVNGRPQRVLECGMNTCFVSVDARDRVGDEVVLLGDGLTERALAEHFDSREHEILCRYTQMGVREYGPLPASPVQRRAAAADV